MLFYYSTMLDLKLYYFDIIGDIFGKMFQEKIFHRFHLKPLHIPCFPLTLWMESGILYVTRAGFDSGLNKQTFDPCPLSSLEQPNNTVTETKMGSDSRRGWKAVSSSPLLVFPYWAWNTYRLTCNYKSTFGHNDRFSRESLLAFEQVLANLVL